ncbi:MAG: transglycosylase SLT domain-containing protein [Acidobacteriaceae bacterium]
MRWTVAVTGRTALFFIILSGSVALLMGHAEMVHTTGLYVHAASNSHHGAKVQKVGRTPRASHVKHDRRSNRGTSRATALHAAYVESISLRPLATRLVQQGTPEAYAQVKSWANRHHGEAAALGFLALGHAYLEDGHDNHAIADLKLAAKFGDALGDFTDYLLAQAQMGVGLNADAESSLKRLETNYPDSLLTPLVPALLANAYLNDKQPAEALHVLSASASRPIGNRADYLLAYAKAELALGNQGEALAYYRRVFTEFPVTAAGIAARKQISSMDLLHTLPTEDLRINADALFDAGQYRQAKEEYLLLAQNTHLDEDARNAYYVAAAACDLKLNRLTQDEIDGIKTQNDDAGARLLYLNVELARSKSDDTQIRHLVDEMEQRFPHSSWLARALYSAGNMYLLEPNYPEAVAYYSELSKRFPYMCSRRERHDACSDLSAKSHWRAAWLTYRLGHYDEAARLFDAEIERYPGTEQFSTALYWRGRIYEREGKKPLAAAYYHTEIRLYPHYYYALLAAERLKKMGSVHPVEVPALDRINPQLIPDFSDDVPQYDPHVLRARLLANAGLDGYVASEISSAPGSRKWGAFAQAQIFSSGDEAWRAMFALMRVMPFYTQAPFGAIPMSYWKMLYPTPYWPQIVRYSRARGLDPYMVASLIRQESGFRPDAISHSNAYGLMQLLPSVGRMMARKAGMRYFRTRDLLNPIINIELGTLYLKQLMDEFNGNPEYAFAAYNAGDNRVVAWKQIGGYHGMAEFVESIPFTQTHEYVESIVRNQYMYRVIDKLSTQEARRQVGSVQAVRK